MLALSALAATSLSPTASGASLGKSARFIFFVGCMAGLPNAEVAGRIPSCFAPFSSPSSTDSKPDSIVPEP